MNKTRTQNKKKKSHAESNAGSGRMSLGGFLPVQMPDHSSIKFVYVDQRNIVSAGNEAEYVYRGNSLFDPDFTGVGGQPDGFDQWKLLYGNYRVVASTCEVMAHNQSAGNGSLLAVVPATSGSNINEAEYGAGLRHAKSAFATQQTPARVRNTLHTSQAFGWEDVSVLSADSCSAAISTNPSSQWYWHVMSRTTGATDTTEIYVRITYYARMENPLDTIDAMHARARERRKSLVASSALPSTTPGALPSRAIPDAMSPAGDTAQQRNTAPPGELAVPKGSCEPVAAAAVGCVGGVGQRCCCAHGQLQ